MAYERDEDTTATLLNKLKTVLKDMMNKTNLEALEIKCFNAEAKLRFENISESTTIIALENATKNEMSLKLGKFV